MKKYGLVLALVVMILAMGCGKGEADVDSGNGNDQMNIESNVFTEDVGSANKEDESTITVPDVEYEEWLVDVEGNKLFGYNVPLGWTSEKGDVSKGHVSVELYEYGSEQQWGDITIHCSKGNDWMMWYETEIAPDYMQNSGVAYDLEKTIETVYGKCKIFYGRTDEENRGESIYSLIKLDDNWCVCFIGYDGYYGLDILGCFMEDYIHIITGEKQTAIMVDYEYENYLVDEKGNQLMGFNTPIGMERVEDDPAVCMQNSDGSKTVRILNTDCEYAYFIMNGGREDAEHIFKDEIETVYGTAKIYDVKLAWGSGEVSGVIYLEEALFCVNGVYIWVQYTDYTAEGCVNELEEIIKSQLFVQE